MSEWRLTKGIYEEYVSGNARRRSHLIDDVRRDQLFLYIVVNSIGTHGYTSSYVKLVLLELALFDVPVQSAVSLFWFFIA